MPHGNGEKVPFATYLGDIFRLEPILFLLGVPDDLASFSRRVLAASLFGSYDLRLLKDILIEISGPFNDGNRILLFDVMMLSILIFESPKHYEHPLLFYSPGFYSFTNQNMFTEKQGFTSIRNRWISFYKEQSISYIWSLLTPHIDINYSQV